MYNANAQNSILRLRTELSECSYNQNMKDYLANLIMSVMNFPKKTAQVRHFIKNMGGNKIIMVWYPMSVPFMGRNYNVPLQIYIMKNVPYEPPQIFLEVTQGSGANTKNTDIDPNNNRIMTNSLRNWNQYSVMDNVMNEIFASFSRTFPIYKKSANDNQQQQGAGGGGGIYNMIKNEVFNLYQNNRGNNNQGQGNFYGFQPPTKNIYGRAMTREGDNNQQQPNSFGGGIYGNNNNYNNQQQPNSFGGGIYGNNNNNYNQQPQPNSFGGGIYGNNNNNNQPNSFGGGIYGNNNNNYNNNNYNQQPQPNSFGGGIYGNNNNNNNNNNPNQFGAGGIFDQPKKNPDEEFKEILINEVSSKISNNLVSEKQRLYNQNQKMKNYKSIFSQENEKLNNFVNTQNQIKTKCDEDMNNMNHALNRIQDQINKSKNMILNEENCINLVDVPDPGAIKMIAQETCMEEMILVVRKGFERKKISFDQAIMFMRNSARDLFAIKFLKDKAINKYQN